MSPAQKNAALQARAAQIGEDAMRREMAAMTRASQVEYESVLRRSGLRYGNR